MFSCKYFVFYCFIVVCLNALHSYGGNKIIYVLTLELSYITPMQCVSVNGKNYGIPVPKLIDLITLCIIHCHELNLQTVGEIEVSS